MVSRTNPVDNVFWDYMKKQYEKREHDTWVLFNRKTRTRFLGRPKMMKSLCERAGVRYFDFYGLRHFGAVWAASHGVSIIKISRMLGHQSLRTTGIYLKHDVEDMRSATKPFEQFTVVGPVVDRTKKTTKNPTHYGNN